MKEKTYGRREVQKILDDQQYVRDLITTRRQIVKMMTYRDKNYRKLSKFQREDELDALGIVLNIIDEMRDPYD